MEKAQATQSPRVIIRFEDEFVHGDKKKPIVMLEKSDPVRWRKFSKLYGDTELRPALMHTDKITLQKLQAQALERDPTYKAVNFDNFYVVETEKADDLDELVKSLSYWNGVRSVDVEILGPLPLVSPADDPRYANQGYLTPAPDGINAPFAWAITGGDGEGQSFVDVEGGWTVDHEDLIDKSPTLIHGTQYGPWKSHGTSVLGEICATDNAIGGVGITPNVSTVLLSSVIGSTIADAIIAGISNLAFGDTMLIEQQIVAQSTPAGAPTYGPIETVDINFEALRLASALGIIVVEAGGNGTNNGGTPALDLDVYTKGGLQILNPTSPDFRDSGAIIVAASTSASPHTRMPWSTYGSRIDCFSWGQNVNTTSSNGAGATGLYTTTFNGTSSASPIITGAALSVQGIYEAATGSRLSPAQMRGLLSDTTVNTSPSATEATLMGVQPDLAAILTASQLANIPDIYLRDFVGDNGDPHTSGSISASPDIILRQELVANAQSSFGVGSGTENSNTLGQNAEAGQDNYVYVRSLNQGTSDAIGSTATVYWSPASTLVTPDLWNLVGTVSMPAIPTGEILTCADALTWQNSDIPAAGHYCFVGIMDHPQDPAPQLADFQDFDNFRRFIRSNNNVTWRNFNVVDLLPNVPTITELPFLVAGWHDKALDMGVELIAKLPKGVKAELEIPIRFLTEVGMRLEFIEQNKPCQTVRAKIPESGRINLGFGEIPAKARYQMKLIVKHPKGVPLDGRVIARQLYKNEEEVGRVSWQFQNAELRKKNEAHIKFKE